ncbi:hypothetical protein AXF42_Ash007609 [Apostasia shenzhenica]|uniref:Uncharacterized protein n=1 Tax=Apostasia shenzhenica TaxID=1088818 RepID=A0A2I0A5Z1_9ASPA|nr:hypothetical protein AXF42_Ash007609 [Apostasia shenzhenica]
MGSTIRSGSGIFFCLISKSTRVLFQARYCHIAGNGTFAFLIDYDGHTYFTMVESNCGSAGAIRFLELMHE